VNKFFFVVLICFSTQKNKAQNSVLNQADSLYSTGNFSKAIEIYKTYNSQNEVYEKVAKAYMAIGNYGEALKYYKASVEVRPDDVLLKYDYAKLLFKTKNYEMASKLFNDLVYFDYRNPNYHYELGLALEELNDSTAMNRFRSTYDLDPTHQKAIYKIAKYFVQKRQYELAEKYINKGMETYMDNVELINLKALNFYYQQNYLKTIFWFEKLISLGESSEFIHEKLSISYAQEYEYKKAIEQRLLALKFNPFDAKAIYVIGTYYEKLEDFINAEKYFKQSLLLKDVPLDGEYVDLGTVYNRQGKYKEAIEAFQIAVRENPENIEAVFFSIISKDKYYKDIDTKIKLYENFMEQYPKSVYVPFAESRLKELKQEKFLEED
jgi:tetratricopeptide (TPR) repeat protein